MKIASSSASFARAIAAGELTQLEWLDVCANELEVDSVVFDAAHFPRTDDQYLAQLKKLAVDLGLSVAALASDELLRADGERWFDIALALGAPLAIVRAPAGDDAAAWGTFADMVKVRSSAAKRVNVTLATRNAPGTLCAGIADLKRIAKDVDSAWLRFALDPSALGGTDAVDAVLAKTVIAIHPITDATQFAMLEDVAAPALVKALAHFRGCVLLENANADTARDAYHRALGRFAALRARALVPS